MTTTKPQLKPPYLFVTDESHNEPRTIALECNSSAFVGSGSNCRIVLDGEAIQSIHCMLLLNEENVLIVQDWNTGSTLLNGEPVTQDTEVSSGDCLQVGDHRIVAVLDSKSHQAVSQDENAEAMPASTNSNSIAGFIESDSAESNSTLDTVPLRKQSLTDSIISEVEEFVSEVSDFNDGTVTSTASDASDEPFVYDDEFEEVEEDTFGREGNMTFDQSLLGNEAEIAEEAELLRTEIDQLRFELAEKDALLDAQHQPNNPTEDGELSDDQTLRLVTRLEDLLEELESSDERVRGMEELVRMSDQATSHEQEERRQLESWLTEIEQRISQREAEAEAEKSRLSERLADTKSQLKQTEAQLGKALKSVRLRSSSISNAPGPSGGSTAPSDQESQAAAQEVMQELQQQLVQLKTQLESATEENDQLRRQSQSDEQEAEAREAARLLEQQLLEMQVETARERAEISRQQADLQRLKGELEQQLSKPKTMDVADSRIEAMRQHLRDIHEEELQEKQEKRERSLSGRISKLLNRV